MPRMALQGESPLAYAQGMLAHLTDLGRVRDGVTLSREFVRAAAQISGCELSQLYLFDEPGRCLNLSAECLNGVSQPQDDRRFFEDYQRQQLLQHVLRCGESLSLSDLHGGLYDIGLLPTVDRPWQSLLCVPLHYFDGAVAGVLLCAGSTRSDLQTVVGSLSQLGTFVLNQLGLMMLRPCYLSAPSEPSADSVPANTYGLIGESVAMAETCRLIGKVQSNTYTVLLLGETGTGKEVVARAIHQAGPRRGKAFVVQNCAAFPEGLLESELFGYRKGAFTGADRDRIGLFDAADGGTLLLDEIGDMPLSLQAKLLRVLQEREIRPLGASVAHKINVRIIAATHRDLAQRVAQGSFREDLYYRLAQFPIHLPPLRERERDVLELARHFADNACSELQRDRLQWSAQALNHLSNCPFPGNVRELKGQVERAVLLCDGNQLRPEHFVLFSAKPGADTNVTLREHMEHTERLFVMTCLRKHRGNCTRAAQELGMARRTLLYRLSRLNIHAGDLREQA